MMNRFVEIIGISILVGLVLLTAIFIFLSFFIPYTLSKSVADYQEKMLSNRDGIIERIDSFFAVNKYLPDSLTCIGFVTSAMMSYEYNSIYFDYTKLNETDYLIEYESPYVVRTQYLSSEGCWIEELNDALNADTSSVINKISNIGRIYNILPDIDSVGYNRLQICPTLNDGILPDSVAYLCYFYKGGKKRCEGWVTFSRRPEDGSRKQIGEWKYYDKQGKCYRKFWVYKQDGEFIFH